MNSPPALYRLTNKLQRRDAKEIIKEFADVFQLRTDGKDSLVDVGCGTGDVLIDFIHPILPETCTKVIGVDISPEFIEFSKNAYADYDKVDFKVLNIEMEGMPLQYYDKFDHVTSFFCLHWIKNQRQAMKNIYDMLLNDGDCLLVFIPTCPIFDIYKMLAAECKWSKYMMDLDRFLPPCQNNAEPLITYTKLLEEIGFVDQKVDVRDKTFTYEGEECFKGFLTSINPFIRRMPLYEQNEYINKMFEYCKERFAFEKMDHIDDYMYTFSYQIVVAYAKK